MSMTLSVDLKESGCQSLPDNPSPPSPETYFNAGTLPYVSIELDRLLTQHECKPLSEFIYDGDMLSEEEYEEIGEARPEREWFDAAEGLLTLGCLTELLESRDAEEAIDGRTVEDILYELQAVQSILQRAKQLGEPFSFYVC